MLLTCKCFQATVADFRLLSLVYFQKSVLILRLHQAKLQPYRPRARLMFLIYHFMWRLIVHRRGSSVKVLPFCPRDKGQSWEKGQGQVQQNRCQASLVCSVVTSSLSGNCLTSGLVVWVQDLAWIQITILVGYFHCVEFESHTHKYNYQNSQGLVCMCVYLYVCRHRYIGVYRFKYLWVIVYLSLIF